MRIERMRKLLLKLIFVTYTFHSLLVMVKNYPLWIVNLATHIYSLSRSLPLCFLIVTDAVVHFDGGDETRLSARRAGEKKEEEHRLCSANFFFCFSSSSSLPSKCVHRDIRVSYVFWCNFNDWKVNKSIHRGTARESEEDVKKRDERKRSVQATSTTNTECMYRLKCARRRDEKFTRKFVAKCSFTVVCSSSLYVFLVSSSGEYEEGQRKEEEKKGHKVV